MIFLAYALIFAVLDGYKLIFHRLPPISNPSATRTKEADSGRHLAPLYHSLLIIHCRIHPYRSSKDGPFLACDGTHIFAVCEIPNTTKIFPAEVALTYRRSNGRDGNVSYTVYNRSRMSRNVTIVSCLDKISQKRIRLLLRVHLGTLIRPTQEPKRSWAPRLTLSALWP